MFSESGQQNLRTMELCLKFPDLCGNKYVFQWNHWVLLPQNDIFLIQCSEKSFSIHCWGMVVKSHCLHLGIRKVTTVYLGFKKKKKKKHFQNDHKRLWFSDMRKGSWILFWMTTLNIYPKMLNSTFFPFISLQTIFCRRSHLRLPSSSWISGIGLMG